MAEHVASTNGGGGVDVQPAQMVRMDYNPDQRRSHRRSRRARRSQQQQRGGSNRAWRGDHTARRRDAWWSFLKRLVPADIWTGCRLMCCFTLFRPGLGGGLWTEHLETTSLVADLAQGPEGTGGAGPPRPPVEKSLLELYLDLILAKAEFETYSDSCSSSTALHACPQTWSPPSVLSPCHPQSTPTGGPDLARFL